MKNTKVPVTHGTVETKIRPEIIRAGLLALAPYEWGMEWGPVTREDMVREVYMAMKKAEKP